MDEFVNGVWTQRIWYDNTWTVTQYFPHGWNHVVTIIGYDDATSRFKVQNSWGTGFGENGFFYISYATIDAGISDVMQVAYGIAAANSACPNAMGTGLTADLYNSSSTTMPTGTPNLSRTDATVNFDWGTGSPATGINADNFMIRWQGQVEAPYTGNYTFAVNGDDGYNLWVNGVQVIKNWNDQAPTKRVSDPIALTACQRYDIRLEYYERSGGATCQLFWTPPAGGEAIIPAARLYPPVACATNVALGRTATASSVELINGVPSSYTADKAFDGSTAATSRWSSLSDNNSWLQVDLGTTYDICKVMLNWEAAYGKDYNIQVSDDGSSWTTVKAVTGNTTYGSPITYPMSNVSGRYVRMQGITRGTQWGYSLYEFGVYGTVRQLINNGIYLVAGKPGASYFDMQGGTASESPVYNSALNVSNPANQQFTVTHLGNNIYKIAYTNSGKPLSTQGGNTYDGVTVVQATDNGSAAQKWEAIPAGGGFFYLKNVSAGKTIQVVYPNVSGATLACNPSSASDYAKWKFITPGAVAHNPVVAGANGISVSPNPASGVLTVQFTASTQAATDLTLTDLSGRLMTAQSIQATNGANLIQMSVQDLPAGLYLLRLRCGTEAPATARIVVQH